MGFCHAFWRLFVKYFGDYLSKKKTILVVNSVKSDRWKSSTNDVVLNCLNWLPVNYLRNKTFSLCHNSLVKADRSECLGEFESRSVKTRDAVDLDPFQIPH